MSHGSQLFSIKQVPSKQSKQSDTVSLKRSEAPFLCIPISCTSWQLEVLDKYFCLHAPPLRGELARSKGKPDKAAQRYFGVLTKVGVHSRSGQGGGKGWPLSVQAFMEKSEKEGENF